MSSFLTLDSLSLTTPDGTPLFDSLTLSLGRERIGLVGRNGCGKSTLLRTIAGDVESASGSLSVHGRLGRLAQIADETQTVSEALGATDGLARLVRMAAGDGTLEDAELADWTLQPRLESALAATGLRETPLDSPLSRLSGGERTRVMIARLLLEEPDMLLLDEPTNNLDTEGRAAIASLLKDWRGGALVASHDRELLEHMDRIVELSPVGVTVFGGGWREFREARDAARAQAAAGLVRSASALKRAETEAQRAKERQDRRDKAGRASRAKSAEPKMLLDARAERAEHTAARGGQLADRLTGDAAEALEAARTRVEITAPVTMDFPPVRLPRTKDMLHVTDAVARFGNRHLFGPLSFTIRGPERVAIAGPNGAGKSTLMRMILGELTPASGEVLRHTKRLACLDQHVSLLPSNGSILDAVHAVQPHLTQNEAYAALARFAFRNEAAHQSVTTLSGGERLRAGLAAIFATPQPPELLLLDEPTNHLDMDTIQALETALKAYDGALLVISHDPAFLAAIGVTREIALP
jgi:ATPase subunit of ABC transporter with duplicated ATPase domains